MACPVDCGGLLELDWHRADKSEEEEDAEWHVDADGWRMSTAMVAVVPAPGPPLVVTLM
jgi:hypothetical protein